jgi:hypothetical protein
MLKLVAAPAARDAVAVLAVTPAGAPETAMVSGPVKVPLTVPHEIWTDVDPPTKTVALVGLAASVQLAGTVTVSENVTV